MANIPTYIQLPSAPPTTDPAVVGYITQVQIALNQWILQAGTAINNAHSTLTIGDWTISQDSTGDLILAFDGTRLGSASGTWNIPNPAGQNFTVMAVGSP